MRLGKVIGRVTLSQTIPAFEGARWLVVNPYTRDQFQSGEEPPVGMSPLSKAMGQSAHSTCPHDKLPEINRTENISKVDNLNC